MADIVVIGSLNADLVVRSPHFPSPGETVPGEDLATIPGGKGANQAVAAARLGASVALVGCVGNDAFGEMLIENLKRNQIDTRYVRQDTSAATGTAIITVDAGGENTIVLSPGANARLDAKHIEPALSGAKFLLMQFEIPMQAVMDCARIARQKRIKLILNPAPAREVPDELLGLADFLVPNEAELAFLAGKKISGSASLEGAARSLLARGASNVIVTMGQKGAWIVNHLGAKHVPSFRVKPVDTTAAGDAFIGGMAVALLRRKSLEDAVKYGCACGALAATRFGAQPSLPTAQEVAALLKSAGED